MIFEVILGVCLALVVICIPVSVYAVYKAWQTDIEMQSFKRSTHQIQYVPHGTTNDLLDDLKKQELNYFEGDEPMSKSEEGGAL